MHVGNYRKQEHVCSAAEPDEIIDDARTLAASAGGGGQACGERGGRDGRVERAALRQRQRRGRQARQRCARVPTCAGGGVLLSAIAMDSQRGHASRQNPWPVCPGLHSMPSISSAARYQQGGVSHFSETHPCTGPHRKFIDTPHQQPSHTTLCSWTAARPSRCTHKSSAVAWGTGAHCGQSRGRAGGRFGGPW